jgi:heme-degrading monooxygenase HmoA
MVLEIAQIDVTPGMEAEFEAGVAKAGPVFRRAKGCTGMTLQRSIEKPGRYRLFVQWETLETIPSIFAALRTSPSGAVWWATASQRPRRWSTSSRR